ncbi:MAG: YkgJ family cysteine cluster protein [Eubacteriales bacterium]|jgi:Fe-S-cluster containining protein|nr:YkgJ family cysteine cluster protein [Bacillota bacterium]MDQ7789018.1 YkgJ family cysteine cluster protein [Clostridia bacterium]MDZ4042444.1 YkgJ family cysteine cluster protein [Eubacteriales bacterium]
MIDRHLQISADPDSPKLLMKELGLKDSFQFECRLECMGMCCNSIRIVLDPWDVEVLARHLGLGGKACIDQHCTLEFTPESHWPIVWLAGAYSGPCTFLNSDNKCSVYTARPTICRTYPLGRAVRIDEDGQAVEKVFLVEKAAFCLGGLTERLRTVESWLNNEGVRERAPLSNLYLALIYYAETELHSPKWMNKPIANMLNPLLFAPEMLRAKLDIGEDLDHAEFYRRRLDAVKLLLTDLAAGFGCGPLAAKAEESVFKESMMERIRHVLAIGERPEM